MDKLQIFSVLSEESSLARASTVIWVTGKEKRCTQFNNKKNPELSLISKTRKKNFNKGLYFSSWKKF